jgi:hypothetical protein
MQSPFEPYDDREFEPSASSENQHIDFESLRILATWIAQRAGIDPELRAQVDRRFVVAQAHAQA